jgi:DNA-binding beta-propeller fold protein YncE
MAAAPDAAARYEIIHRWKLPGAGGWDYVTFDAPLHRLFITRGDRVEVLDAATGKPIGQVAPNSGVHGVALAADLGRGYASNGRGNSITEFDYRTLKVLREVPDPGSDPDAILYEPTHHRLYAFNGHSKDATVYDAGSMAVIARIPLPGGPEFAVDGGDGRVYVNIENDRGQLVVIEAATGSVVATWALEGCESPTGLAIDATRHRLFSVCANQVMAVTDSTTGRAVARVPIGLHPDAAAYDARHGLAFSSNGAGTLTIVRADEASRYPVAATLATQPGARTMALDPESGRLYLVTADFGPTPPATSENPRPRPQPVADTFTVLVVAPR